MLRREEHMDEVHERKKIEIWRFTGVCGSNVWKASCLPKEVGARDFTARSLCKVLLDISVIRTRKSRPI